LLPFADVDWLWQLDKDVFRTIHVGLHRDWLDPIFWVISSSGLGYVQALVVISLLKFERAKHYVPALLWSLAAVALLTPLAKRLAPRMRPSNMLGVSQQEEFYGWSFPSGHTMSSFALAVMLVLLLRGTAKAWIGWNALIWAFFVGVARIYRGVHWPSDVFAGAAMGAFAACAVYLALSHLWRGLPDREPSVDDRGPVSSAQAGLK